MIKAKISALVDTVWQHWTFQPPIEEEPNIKDNWTSSVQHCIDLIDTCLLELKGEKQAADIGAFNLHIAHPIRTWLQGAIRGRATSREVIQATHKADNEMSVGAAEVVCACIDIVINNDSIPPARDEVRQFFKVSPYVEGKQNGIAKGDDFLQRIDFHVRQIYFHKLFIPVIELWNCKTTNHRAFGGRETIANFIESKMQNEEKCYDGISFDRLRVLISPPLPYDSARDIFLFVLAESKNLDLKPPTQPPARICKLPPRWPEDTVPPPVTNMRSSKFLAGIAIVIAVLGAISWRAGRPKTA